MLDILITGSRNMGLGYFTISWLELLNKFPQERGQVIVGCAKSGADYYARERLNKVKVYKADWNTHGKRAGFIRNQKMVDALLARPSHHTKVCLAVWDGKSNGTRDTMNRCRDAGIPVFYINFELRVLNWHV